MQEFRADFDCIGNFTYSEFLEKIVHGENKNNTEFILDICHNDIFYNWSDEIKQIIDAASEIKIKRSTFYNSTPFKQEYAHLKYKLKRSILNDELAQFSEVFINHEINCELIIMFYEIELQLTTLRITSSDEVIDSGFILHIVDSWEEDVRQCFLSDCYKKILKKYFKEKVDLDSLYWYLESHQAVSYLLNPQVRTKLTFKDES